MFSLTSKSPAHPHLVLPTLAKMVSPLSEKLKQHPLFFPLYYPSQWLYHCESCLHLRYIAAVHPFLSGLTAAPLSRPPHFLLETLIMATALNKSSCIHSSLSSQQNSLNILLKIKMGS